MTAEYRTPEEHQRQKEQLARVRPALAQAVTDMSFCKAAMALGEPQDVVELWVDRCWNSLRDALDGEDRLAAILLLLDGQADAGLVRTLTFLQEGPDV